MYFIQLLIFCKAQNTYCNLYDKTICSYCKIEDMYIFGKQCFRTYNFLFTKTKTASIFASFKKQVICKIYSNKPHWQTITSQWTV